MKDVAPGLLAVVLFGAIPIAAHAQSYAPPKIVKQGSTTATVAGSGSVTVKVFVKADGSAGPVTVEKSTNGRDDAAAAEIAKTSTYKPGLRDGKAIDAFYTYVLKFTGNSVAVETDANANGAEIAAATALIRAGKYAEAKTQLQAYLVTHPDDPDPHVLLGVAGAYLNDAAGATAAFDKAGTIPERYKVVAAKAYADAAVDALKAKNNDRAIALAGKALALQENVNALFIRGTAYANAQNYAGATADLEKAKGMATAGNADAATLNAIDASLATSYVFGGQAPKGIALAQALKARDPGNSRVDDTLASYYNQQAAAAVAAGKKEEAVTLLETAATAVPARAVILYVQAANVLSQGTAVDWKRVKAEVDKALALDAKDARANYVAGVALANAKDLTGALVYLEKAKANAGSDAALSAQIDAALKTLRARP